jgi:tetratricopeptide (TPR) repeat protein
MRNTDLRKGLIFGIALLFFIDSTSTVNGQLLQDTSAVNLIRKGIGYIYGQEFTNAENILNEVNTRYPGHPATYLYKAIVIYYKNYPLIPDNPQFKSFESQLRASMRICEARSGWLDDPEKLLIDFCSRGLLMLCYSENGMSREVTSIALTTYKCVKKSFQYKSAYPDFCYFTGLYNYYREAYPDRHPVYKALAVLFPRGDKPGGLKDLRYAAENSIVLMAEAYSILSWIYIYYENNYPEAIKYSKTISDKYPSNLLFRGEYIKNLLLMGKYDDAEKIILSSENVQHTYFRGELSIFRGFLQEKKYHDYSLAHRYYDEGIAIMKTFGTRGKDYADFANDGLKRIRDIQNRKRSAG